MQKTRRQVLKSGGGMTLFALLAAAGWLKPGDAAAQAWNKGAFEAKSLDEAMKAFGGGTPAQSKDIAFVATPDIAENGAVVPITIASALPKTESIAILIEKNPNMLAASFDTCPAPSPSIGTRQDGTELERLCAREGRRQVFRRVEGDQGHPRRLRRLAQRSGKWQIR
jgi:sulfur-oxidizing protein SoxY